MLVCFCEVEATQAISMDSSDNSRWHRNRERLGRSLSIGVFGVLLVATIARIVVVDWSMPQGFDEPCHIAAGMKWVDLHDYTLDSLHPPLARDAVAIPLHLEGVHFPNFRPQDTSLQGYCTEIGNAILNDGGHYFRNLSLARFGMLPFLCIAAVIVLLWSAREAGWFAATVAAFLFLTLPSLLAFSSMAYTDLPAMCTQLACIFAFGVWLRKKTWIASALLGLCAGLAFSSKLTSFLFLPFACAAMLAVTLGFSRVRLQNLRFRHAAQFAMAACIGFVTLWGSYGFSSGRLQTALNISRSEEPTFHRFGIAGGILHKIVLADPIIPAPDLVRGVVIAHQKNGQEPESYLLGNEKPGGWWYFFPAALALKTPIPLLILAALGVVTAVMAARRGESSSLIVLAAVIGIFVATLFVTLRVGTRHVLVLLPLLTVLAGFGSFLLARVPRKNPVWGQVALVLLLAWQAIASIRSQPDFLAYFNEFAPSDPSKALVKGCDLDCGQDVFLLSDDLQKRGVAHVGMGIWTSADLSNLRLPPFDILRPRQPTTGWIAVSVRALKTGKVVFCQNGHILPDENYPEDSLAWLEAYRPIARIGKTILLYYIPDTSMQTAQHTVQPSS